MGQHGDRPQFGTRSQPHYASNLALPRRLVSQTLTGAFPLLSFLTCSGCFASPWVGALTDVLCFLDMDLRQPERGICKTLRQCGIWAPPRPATSMEFSCPKLILHGAWTSHKAETVYRRSGSILDQASFVDHGQNGPSDWRGNPIVLWSILVCCCKFTVWLNHPNRLCRPLSESPNQQIALLPTFDRQSPHSKTRYVGKLRTAFIGYFQVFFKRSDTDPRNTCSVVTNVGQPKLRYWNFQSKKHIRRPHSCA